MNNTILHYLPILTTIVSILFARTIFQRYLGNRMSLHLLWWGMGVVVYGLGTFAESWITLMGWNPFIFKFWYIVGALLGGAPLAQGTVWFLLKSDTARRLTYGMVGYVVLASVFVVASPINYDLINPNLPSGKVFAWQWVRAFSPFINLYAVIFLIGGAILSAYRFGIAFRLNRNNRQVAWDRMIGNILIAIGAILPGIGGSASRAGHTEILYLTEILGISLIWLGYWFNVRKRPVKI
ncbi:MAG: hypothetical protein H8E14_15960 [Candidatus Marinimicrobia bacterium]|nr:hypothetical protein [Candidatus Neomarinimicrobiota bacterium]